ncbi:hypothetical protein [Streptomyces sp. NBC_00258]|uniref:hypothetical protein n=1 Tax=Streptomyces sp. NBC_00258 TaxID=2903642 RepID=UPI002E27DBB0|nr:hypothetical protein [Streptomyces sp. NBC_00258]
MSTLALLIVLLLVLVGLLTAGGLAYVVHRHPALAQPLTVGLSGLALLGALVAVITAR